jgi:hypothetical protein
VYHLPIKKPTCAFSGAGVAGGPLAPASVGAVAVGAALVGAPEQAELLRRAGAGGGRGVLARLILQVRLTHFGPSKQTENDDFSPH